MLFIVGLGVGVLIAAARLAHQAGNLSTRSYRLFLALTIAAALAIAALLVIERMEAA